MLDATLRAQAIYKAMVAKMPKANLGKMSGDPNNPDPKGTAEYDLMYQNVLTIFGQADLSYIVTNAVVQPGTLVAPSGATVATSGSPTAQTGTVTSNSPTLSGTGRLS